MCESCEAEPLGKASYCKCSSSCTNEFKRESRTEPRYEDLSLGRENRVKCEASARCKAEGVRSKDLRAKTEASSMLQVLRCEQKGDSDRGAH